MIFCHTSGISRHDVALHRPRNPFRYERFCHVLCHRVHKLLNIAHLWTLLLPEFLREFLCALALLLSESGQSVLDLIFLLICIARILCNYFLNILLRWLLAAYSLLLQT